jgi:hypothetical protein
MNMVMKRMFHKIFGNSWVPAQLEASHEGLSSIEFVMSKVMSTLVFVKARVYVFVPILPWVTGDVLPLFHKMRIMIQAFLPVLHKLEYATVREVNFSISRSCTHDLLNCLTVFLVVVLRVIF